MNYFNADGSQSFCGNGSRCVVQFAAALGLIESKAHYLAIDGPHHSHINNGIVATQMQAVNHIETIGNDLFINTGSPHYIRFVNDVHSEDLLSIAHQIRYNDRFSKEGTNVNLVSMQQDTIHVRTYERGVEGETLSCGTGVTAVAIAHCHRNGLSGKQKIAVHTQGGLLHVQLNVSENNFSQIELIGPAKKVFEGEWQR
jgi:diaminopimelate epimerase